jgi:HSP20 family protein
MSLLAKRAQPKVNGGLLDWFDFDRFWDDRLWPDAVQFARVPATNIHETEDSFVIEMAVPGLDKKDFHVEIKNNVLEVSVEKERDEVEDEKNYRRREFSFYSFNRSFSLPNTVVTDKIGAKYDKGVLMLTLPKSVEAKKKPMKEISVS